MWRLKGKILKKGETARKPPPFMENQVNWKMQYAA